MVKITGDLWYWHHNVSECYYHIQLTIKYRRSVFQKDIENEIVEIMSGFKERYYIDVHTVGYNKNHVHILCRFLPKYSGDQVIRIGKKHNVPVIVSEIPRNKKAIMVRGILVRWILHWNSEWERR